MASALYRREVQVVLRLFVLALEASEAARARVPEKRQQRLAAAPLFL